MTIRGESYKMMNVFLPLVVSCTAGFVGTWASMYVARLGGILDRPGEMKVHDHDVPRFGGLGIVLGTFLGTVVCGRFSTIPKLKPVTILFVSLPVILTGAIDDMRGLSPKAKLLGQLMSSLGMSVILITGLVHGVPALHLVLVVAASTAFLCFLTNSTNLLDGMDGLASGIAIIICLSLSGLAYLAGYAQLVVLPASLAGACFGFLLLNLPPAETFMGDIGSNFLGYIIGLVTLQLIAAEPLTLSKIIGIGLVLLVPISDTSFAIIRRLRNGGNPLIGDRLHLYDCLHEEFGGRPWVTLTVMWSITLISCVLGIIAAVFLDSTQAILLAFFGVAGVFSLAAKVGSLGVRRGSSPVRD